jgi:hypothetical protein
MAKLRIIFLLVVIFSITAFAVQSLSHPCSLIQAATLSATERRRNMTEEERKKELERWQNMTKEEKEKEVEKRLKQHQLEREQRQKELKMRREQQKLEFEQKKKEWDKEWDKEKTEGFLHEKYALEVTEEQWKVIKPKLDQVQNLRLQVKISMRAGWGPQRKPGSTGPEYMDPKYLHEWSWRWSKPSESKESDELTESERIIEELINLVEAQNTTAEEFDLKMDALRKIRSRQEAEKESKKGELSKALQELRGVLTTRQEAALVLMGRL